MLYGSSVVALYAVLARAGLPTFYDKLLPVPILNLLVRAIDRAAQLKVLRRLDPALIGRALAPTSRNLAYTGLWVAVFAVWLSRSDYQNPAQAPKDDIVVKCREGSISSISYSNFIAPAGR